MIDGTKGGPTGRSEQETGKISLWANWWAIQELNEGRHSLELVKFSCKIYRDKNKSWPRTWLRKEVHVSVLFKSSGRWWWGGWYHATTGHSERDIMIWHLNLAIQCIHIPCCFLFPHWLNVTTGPPNLDVLNNWLGMSVVFLECHAIWVEGEDYRPSADLFSNSWGTKCLPLQTTQYNHPRPQSHPLSLHANYIRPHISTLIWFISYLWAYVCTKTSLYINIIYFLFIRD